MKNVEDIYPLTSVQQGMLMHSLSAPESGMYVSQMSFALKGKLDRAAFRGAWQAAVESHPILRTAFIWEGVKEMLQVVRRQVELPWTEEDWRSLSGTQQQASLEALLAEERRRGFDPARAPLMRFYLIRMAAGVERFVWTYHHLLLDGWSLALVVQEVFARYEAIHRGDSAPPRPAAPRPYGDYVAWLKRQDPSGARAFWKQMLRDFAEPTSLGLPAPSASERAAGLREGILVLSPAATADLESLARRQRLTLNTVVMGAWTLLLSRYSGETDVVFGVTVSGRPAELEGADAMVGLFINTLPIRVAAAPQRPLFTWLQELQALQVEMRQYEHSSLLEAHQESAVPQGTPLFENLYVFENFPMTTGHEALSGLEIDDLWSASSSNYPLNVLVVPGERLSLHNLYARERFAPTTIHRLLGQLRTLLAELVAADPDRRLGELRLLTSAERFQLLAEWNDTATPYDGERCLHQLFAAQAARRGDALAAVCGDAHLSYGELDRRARRLARHLRSLEIGRGDLVAVYLERSLEMIAALLGILRSGAAYVPLEPGHPRRRLAWILRSLGVRAALTQTPLAKTLAGLGDAAPRHLVCLDAPYGSADEAAGTAGATSSDLAYVIFTSGSTGNPKGVVVDHRSVVNLIEWVHRACHFDAADQVLFVTSLGFDLSVFDVFGLLAAGGSLRIASEGEVRDPERLVRRLCQGGVTFWDSAPAALQQLLPFLPPPEQTRPSRLRLLFLSGDWVPLDISDRVRASFRHARLVALGGATEATVWSNFHRVDAIAPHWVSIPYGRPIQNARYYVLDDALEPSPIGVAGDLYIGGDCLALGYSQPRLSADRFLPDPFSPEPGAHFYATGDRARLRADGEMEFLGRLDTQVKIRGFRIELGEIEKVLGGHPALRDVVVLARDDVRKGQDPARRSDKSLVAYVIPRRTGAPGSAELRRYLESRLPEYMIPAAFVTLEAFPVTENGKLDRRRLPAPDVDRPDLEKPFVAPRTPLEDEVAKLWMEKLGISRVGVHDNFFELGGHSLMAVEIIGRLRRSLKTELSLGGMFEQPTVAALAALIAAQREVPTAFQEAALPQIEPAPESLHEPFPLTDLQEAYWIGSMGAFELGLSPHIFKEVAVEGLDLERLELALRRLIERHPMLRAVITAEGRQRILDTVPAHPIETLDLTGKSPQEAESALRSLREEMLDRGPSGDGEPLFKIRVAALGAGRWRLYSSFSLLIADALSQRTLSAELFRLYADPQAPLEPLELSYRDYVIALSNLTGSELYRRSEAYWRQRLSTLPPAVELPLAKPPSSLTRHRMVRRSGGLGREAWQRLKSRAAEAGVTPTMLLCTAYAEVLATWSKHRRFTLNMLFLHRLPLHPQIGALVGNCSSTILLEVDLSPGQSFGERIKALQKQLWNDLEHVHYTGVRVLRELNRTRGNATRAAMPVVFTSALHLGARIEPPADAADDGVRSETLFSSVQTPQVWLDHQTGEEAGGTLGFNWDYVDELFPDGMIRDMFDAYVGLLERLAGETATWHLPSLVPAAHLALWKRVNDTAAPRPETTLHTLFAAQVPERRHEPAVIAAEQTLTYAELAALSDRLGERLRRRGARPNKLVAVVMDRGWEQVAAVLAILRAGAAYLPIDPGFPGERVRYLLRQGEVEIVVTQPWIDAAGWPTTVERLVVGEQDLEQARSAASHPAAASDAVQGPEDLAYVIFTSGSTGQPKGVMIDHRGAVNTLIDVNRRFAVGPGDRVLALSALSFDLSVYDLFGLLAAGGAPVIPEPAAAREPARWRELAERHRVTIWNSVPALMEMFVDHLEGSSQRLPTSLRLVLLSGDWIPVTLPERIRALGREDLRVVSLGGATEASIWSILYPIGEVDPAWTSIPYGRPMANQTFHVLDEALLPRPAWTPGELYIGGVGLARGYWRDEEKTRASFVFDPRTGQRLYRTGDLGRYLPDGTIEFLGREDFQVKIQGYRIELGEIDTTLVQHPAVRAAAVTAQGEARGAKRLVAYVVAEDERPVTAEELRADLGERLPAYMVPTVWVFLDALPLSPNGKVDRQALPAPEEISPPPAPADFASETERELARIWESVLERPGIGVRDNFFELGGHSLAAVRLMGRVRQRFGVELPLSALLEGATIGDMAKRLETDAPARRSALVPIREGGSEAPFFCVHPVGGNVLCYLELARRLGEKRPFYGLQTPDLGVLAGGERDGQPRLEELAAHYVEQISGVEPRGPYLLGGWSMGGVVAFEMARQLERQGREVAVVALIDAAVPEPHEPDEAELTAWFTRDLAALAGDGPPDGGAFDLFRANARALAAYRPQPRKGSVTLFLAADSPVAAGAAEPWRRVARGGVETHTVPGTHYTLLQPPQVGSLAELLRSRLEAAQTVEERS